MPSPMQYMQGRRAAACTGGGIWYPLHTGVKWNEGRKIDKEFNRQLPLFGHIMSFT